MIMVDKGISRDSSASQREAHFIGGGIAGLAGASVLVRETDVPGERLHIYDQREALGGVMGTVGTPEDGYVIRGWRMFDPETYECTWDLLDTVPSFENPDISVKTEIERFHDTHELQTIGRLLDNGNSIDGSHFELDDQLRQSLIGLLVTPETQLRGKRIHDWFEEPFFETNFWIHWSTTFGFSPSLGLVEFRRSLYRFFHKVPRLHTLTDMYQTPYNQFDSLILPIKRLLDKHNVTFHYGCEVTDLDIVSGPNGKTVERIHYDNGTSAKQVSIDPTDLVFVTNGSMGIGVSTGSMTESPGGTGDTGSWDLWERIADRELEVGNPSEYIDEIEKTKWGTFTVTLHDSDLLGEVIEVGEEVPRRGLTTVVDSNWLLSIALPVQPYFSNQPDDVAVFWGYGLHPDREGNYVDKAMSDCTGQELLKELCYHLDCMDTLPELKEESICIPSEVPHITSHSLASTLENRPDVVPEEAQNIAFIGQYVEIPDDVVFTVEYSIRSAMIAVYDLLDCDRDVPPLNKHYRDPKVVRETIDATF